MGKAVGVLNGVGARNDAPADDEVRRQLARILDSAAFRGALRLTHFLAFIVETTLAGKATTIKAYTIAVEALGRSSAFDPQADPIVRVEAGRLRTALARYYAGPGCSDPLTIEVPRGRYVPSFYRGRADSRRRPLPCASGRSAAYPSSRSAGAEESGGGAELFSLHVTEFRELMQTHHRRVAALTKEINFAARALAESRELLDASIGTGLACGASLPLLPTAPSSQSNDAGPTDGRQEQRRQQAQGAAAARARRPRPGGDGGDAPDAGDDPHRLRALRV